MFTLLQSQKRKSKREKEEWFRENGGLILYEAMRPQITNKLQIFTEHEIKKATNNFDDSEILAWGGSSEVYLGTLYDGTRVVIKKARANVMDVKEEFVNEMLILSKVNHKNIIKLLGCCLEVNIPILVFEYIPKGSLYELIHNNNEDFPVSLDTRLNIAIESAEALAYLHSTIYPPIRHGDVKSLKILIDNEGKAKVAGFEASQLLTADDVDFAALVQGTLGYLDPEFLQTRRLTEKSDVYSFGVVILELITRKKAFYEDSGYKINLASMFFSSMKQGKLKDILDAQILSEGGIELFEKIAEIVMRCLSILGEDRPTMRDVAEELHALGQRFMRQPSKVVTSYMKFTEEELKIATNNFDECRLLGEGGFSKVYLGTLKDDRVAVKRAKQLTMSIERRVEFLKEISLLYQVVHKNVVKLLGCCLEVDVPILVYEYVPRGSLYELLHEENHRPIPLSIRLSIAIESAEALAYLHSLKPNAILHRDVKSLNILLDDYWKPKIADFGVSESTFLQGTYGYLDPEATHAGHRLTEKSDVYSFGVVILELITRKRAFYTKSGDKINLASIFKSSMKESKLRDILDAQVLSEGGIKLFEKIAELAMRCLSNSGADRPTMRDVAEGLRDVLVIMAKASPGEAHESADELEESDLCSMVPSELYQWTANLEDQLNVRAQGADEIGPSYHQLQVKISDPDVSAVAPPAAEIVPQAAAADEDEVEALVVRDDDKKPNRPALGGIVSMLTAYREEPSPEELTDVEIPYLERVHKAYCTRLIGFVLELTPDSLADSVSEINSKLSVLGFGGFRYRDVYDAVVEYVQRLESAALSRALVTTRQTSDPAILAWEEAEAELETLSEEATRVKAQLTSRLDQESSMVARIKSLEQELEVFRAETDRLAAQGKSLAANVSSANARVEATRVGADQALHSLEDLRKEAQDEEEALHVARQRLESIR